MPTISMSPSGGRASVTLMFLLALTAPGVTACKGILNVDLPTRVSAGVLNDASFAPTMVQGTIADFECAYTNYAGATGLLTDELIESTGFIAWFSWDLRRIPSSNASLGSNTCTGAGYGVYTPLQVARFTASDSYKRIQAFPDAAVPNKTSLLATAAAYEGYALTLLGEGFCQMAIDGGPAITPAQTLALAEARFTDAMQLATTAANTPILNFATLGRARVRLDQGNKSGADADAKLLPQGFVLNATYDAAAERHRNRVYVDNFVNLYTSVDPRFRNLTFGGVADPRVPTKNANRLGNDGVTALWQQLRYTTETSSMPIATWNEAQLIIAEAEGGQPAVDAINRLHTAAGLPPFSSTDPAAIIAQVYEERRRELFLTGHRLNDMLRLGIPFDSGTDAKGQPFGTTTCLALPDVETLNNPNISHP
jgi:starch-binding outer membrane protein, SusD/RagB family